MTVRIYLPYGAHLRFEGVSDFQNQTLCIAFSYQPKDPKTGLPAKGTAAAEFYKSVICGFSAEEGA